MDNTYSFFLETRASIVKLLLKDLQKHLQRRRNMCNGASIVEMLSALPYPRVKGRECCRKKKGGQRTEREARRKEVGSGRELETRFASCRHLEAISYRFTRAPTKVSVHLHLESSLGIARYRHCNACYEYWPESCGLGFMTCTTRSHATERRETLKLLLQPFWWRLPS